MSLLNDILGNFYIKIIFRNQYFDILFILMSVLFLLLLLLSIRNRRAIKISKKIKKEFPKRSTSFYKILNIEDLPKIKIVIPAFKEEKVIENTLDHIFDTNYPNTLFQVVVAINKNPDIEDHTREIVQHYKERKNLKNLTLIDTNPPDDWMPKSFNLNSGAQFVDHFDAKYYLFLNADSILYPDSLSHLVFLTKKYNVDLISIDPYITPSRLFNKLLAPVISFILTLILVYPKRVKKNGAGMAAGGCVFLDAMKYEEGKGHFHIKNEALDDVKLAEHFHNNNHSTIYRENPKKDPIWGIDWYKDLKEFIDGMKKHTKTEMQNHSLALRLLFMVMFLLLPVWIFTIGLLPLLMQMACVINFSFNVEIFFIRMVLLAIYSYIALSVIIMISHSASSSKLYSFCFVLVGFLLFKGLVWDLLLIKLHKKESSWGGKKITAL